MGVHEVSDATGPYLPIVSPQDLLLAVLVQSDDIKLAPNHAEMPSLLARMKPSALAKHVQKQKVGTKHQQYTRADYLILVLSLFCQLQQRQGRT